LTADRAAANGPLGLPRRQLRKATPEDLGEILTVINITNRPFYKGIVPPERFKDPFMSREELKEELEQKDFYICELEGRIVGVAAFEMSTTRFGTVGIITRMYVLPQFQRRGIGMALIAEIESVARNQGVKEILIWTDPKATWAISFYKKAGYREINPAARYGDEAIDTRITRHRKELLVLQKAL
jgi:N-acetylglutamate synthase-like GNAT family acetyltransferase